jgi:hypothetical protein
MKGSLVRGLSLATINGRNLDELLSGPKRMEGLAFCERCGCRLSQYRDPIDDLCCSCKRAVNPLFKQPA